MTPSPRLPDPRPRRIALPPEFHRRLRARIRGG